MKTAYAIAGSNSDMAECSSESVLSDILGTVSHLHTRIRAISDAADRTLGALPQPDTARGSIPSGMVGEVRNALDALSETLSNAERICGIA